MIDRPNGIKDFFPKGAACWTLDGSPSGLVDQYGNGNHLTPFSAVAYPAIQTESGNSGYKFNGTTVRYLQATDSEWLRPSSLTLIVWIKHTPIGTVQRFVHKSRDIAFGSSYLLFTGTASNSPQFYTFDTAGRFALSTVALVSGRTYCIVCTSDRITLKNKIYINGVMTGQASTTGDIAYTAYPLRFGLAQDFTAKVAGIIGTAILLPYAITPQQVAEYYKAETEPQKKYWFMGAVLSGGAQAAAERIRRAA